MQTRSVFKLILCSLVLMSGCNRQNDGEKFEFVVTGFPKLGEVPERPKLPDMNKIHQDQERLNQDQIEANTKKQEIFKTLDIDPTLPQEKSE